MRGNKGKNPVVEKYDGKDWFAGHRFHLRIDSEGKGVLLVDASKIIYLNGTALYHVKYLLAGKDKAETFKALKKKYRKVSKAVAFEDYDNVKNDLLNYIEGDIYAIEKIDIDSPLAGADELPAPYRMDIALTYRCQNDCIHCYNEEKQKEELDPETWKSVLEGLWHNGIPHIVFTGGEPTLYQGLRELIAKSEELGQITGLITNGRALWNIGELVDAGLDHVQITILSHLEEVHDSLTRNKDSWKETVEGIRNAVKEDLYVSTNTTILPSNVDAMEESMRFVISLGVKNIAFNGLIRSGSGKNSEGLEPERLSTILTRLREIAEEEMVNIIWYSPTPYCEFNPINHGLGIRQCTACSINMAIEPNGDVLPCQSYYRPLGNILKDNWEDIWNNELCSSIRNREYMPEMCEDCELWDLCGGGCPLSIEHGDYLCGDRFSNP